MVPVRGQTAADVLPVLQELFALYGPPGQPQYNGAVERGNGVLKTYTHLHAQTAGHPFRWTSDDVGHAQQLANTISRPWGADGPSPAQAWQQRTPLTPEERQLFATALNTHRQKAAHELGVDLSAELSHADRTRLDRLALSVTLQDLRID